MEAVADLQLESYQQRGTERREQNFLGVMADWILRGYHHQKVSYVFDTALDFF